MSKSAIRNSRNSKFEIAFLLDANITSDMLSQVRMLAAGLNDTGPFRARLLLFGPLDSSSAISRCWPELGSSRKITVDGLKIHRLPRPRGPGRLDALRLARGEALAGCSFLHCFSLSLLDTLLGLSAKRSLSACCLSLSAWPGKRIAEKLGRFCQTPSRQIICFTPALQQALLAVDVPAESCSLILPEPPPVLRKPPDRLAARQQLGLSEHMDVVLADPQITYSSNHRQLTWAAAIIAQFRPSLRVLVPGCHSRLSRLRAFDDSLNPPSLGIYPGEKFDPQVLYAASDLLVLPATGPISPLPLLHAARACLPLVASDDHFFQQYLTHEHNALLFAPSRYTPGDGVSQRIRPLAGMITRALEDRSLATRLAKQLAQDISPSFPPGRTVPAHLELYQQILASPRSS